jgi:hypothetical protein
MREPGLSNLSSSSNSAEVTLVRRLFEKYQTNFGNGSVHDPLPKVTNHEGYEISRRPWLGLILCPSWFMLLKMAQHPNLPDRMDVQQRKSSGALQPAWRRRFICP